MGLIPIKFIGHALKRAGKTVESGVTGAGSALLHADSEAAQSGGHFMSGTFYAAVKDAEKEFKAAEDEIQQR